MKSLNVMLHGADYNPEQWHRSPEVWDEDMRLMKLSKSNSMTIGIFAWTSYEREEGVYSFDWLDTIMDKLAANGAYAVLATPSGAKPAWMSRKYPEILRTDANRIRALHGERHNHCITSPVYRRKVSEINERLAERYKNHPALALWHISNEYGGECHCPLCQEAFRDWIKAKYKTLDAVNGAYWTRFWNHTYTDWAQIESPSPIGESNTHGLNLDWKRYTTDQTASFIENEIAPLRRHTPDIPITANFMGTYAGLNYQKLAKHLDIISWDTYPSWHSPRPAEDLAASVSFLHDVNRSLKGKPFLVMEMTPSTVNWQPVNKLKRPGMHLLSAMQAVAHGSDSVQYFQWRKSRGCSEQHHGAVIDHAGHGNTRVFRDVASVGGALEKLAPVVGHTIKPQAAIVYDWENRWLIDDIAGNRRDKRDYEGECVKHYKYFWKNGIPADVISMDDSFEGYKLIAAPMLYMLRPGVAERLTAFVENGGVLVSGYLSGVSDENGLCNLGGFPGPLRKMLGIWSEELDSLYDGDENAIVYTDGRTYRAHTFCELIHCETAKALAVYQSDFYAGMPALTRNSFGKGTAYYMAARADEGFLLDFYARAAGQLGLRRNIDSQLPDGVTVQKRTDGENEYLFILNFDSQEKSVILDEDIYQDVLDGGTAEGKVSIKGFGTKVLIKETSNDHTA